MTPETRELFERLEPVHLLAITIYGEARGECFAGKIGVAQVVNNRMKDKRWGDTVAKVVLQPKQFSCFLDSDPNSPLLIQKAKENKCAGQDVIWRECYAAAFVVLNGWVRDETKGANHYHTSAVQPKWNTSMTLTARIGEHIFYRG